MTRTRLLTAIPLLGVFALIVVLGPTFFLVLAIAAALACTHEMHGIFRAAGCEPLPWSSFAGVVLIQLAFHAPSHLPVAAAVAAGAALAIAEQALWRARVEGAALALASTLAVLVMPGLLLGFLVAIRNLESRATGAEALDAVALIVVLLAVVFGTDTGAYFAGRAFGRLPLAPEISPKKTVEGFLGGVVVGIAFAVAFGTLFSSGLGIWQLVAYGFVLSVASVMGDLTISLLKRSTGVKDTGRLLPGHGGVLDRLDGLLFASPLLYLLVTGALAVP